MAAIVSCCAIPVNFDSSSDSMREDAALGGAPAFAPAGDRGAPRRLV